MTNAQIRNIGLYVLIAVSMAVLATGTQLGAVLSTDAPIAWRPLAATFVTTLFGTLGTAALSAFRPRPGREELASLVSEVGKEKATDVLAIEAIKQQTGIRTDPLTAEQRALIKNDVADELERRMRSERVRDVAGGGGG